MGKLEKALETIQAAGSQCTDGPEVSPLAMTLVTVGYVATVLSVPVGDVTTLAWLAVFPALAAPWLGVGFTSLLGTSLVAVPFAALIAIPNPFIDREPALRVGPLMVSHGWLTFAGVVLRGVLSMLMVLLMMRKTGFRGFCQALARMKVPSFMVNQLLMVHRYLGVLLEEALTMRRARESRGFGRPRMPLRMWGPFIGELFLRTVSRAERINRAMLARGFGERNPKMFFVRDRWRGMDTAFVALSAATVAAIRIFL